SPGGGHTPNQSPAPQTTRRMNLPSRSRELLLSGSYYDSASVGNGASAANVPKLKGRENYTEWKRQMENCMSIERVGELVLGTEPEPELPEDLEEYSSEDIQLLFQTFGKRKANWKKLNEVAKGILRFRMEYNPEERIREIKSAREI
ncbi:MAG: hypothetical protein Q9180_008614, partial [Flavoplaca navasiana]